MGAGENTIIPRSRRVFCVVSQPRSDDYPSSARYSADGDENASGHLNSIIPQIAQLTAFSETSPVNSYSPQ